MSSISKSLKDSSNKNRNDDIINTLKGIHGAHKNKSQYIDELVIMLEGRDVLTLLNEKYKKVSMSLP